MIKIIGGKYRGRILNVEAKVRPTSANKRGVIFDILTSYFLKNNDSFNKKIIVDAFAGTGALGLEALSRGAKFCYFIEKEYQNVNSIKINFKTIINDNEYKIIHSDFTSITNKELNHKIDIIFLDPPYNYSVNKNMFDPIIKKIKNSTVIIFERKSSSNSLNLNFMRIFDERVVGKTKFIFLKKFN